MKIKLLDTELFVKVNGLKEVTNPITLDRGSIPTEDGLLSTSIFGISPKERKSNFAYIDLQSHFLQPLVYKVLKRLDRRIDSIIGGTKKFIIDKSGELIEDPQGNTGINWLYDNWEKIHFKRNDSRLRNERIDLIDLNKKNELFTKYCIVIPAFYRDINLQSIGSGKPSLHELNVGSDQTNGSSYAKLLRLTASIKSSGAFVFALNNTKFQIQMCLVDLYNYFKSRIEKKRGIIKQGVMGKTIDFGSRLVISAPHFSYNTYKENLVDSKHCGVPLGYCITNAMPFFVGWLSNFFKKEFESAGNKYPSINMKTKEKVFVEVKNPLAYFNDAYCEELLTKYIKSYAQRFDPIEIPTMDGSKCVMGFKASEVLPDGTLKNIDRYMTITDLLYLAAVEIYENKHVIITRYPFATFQSLFTIKARPLATQDTCVMNVNGKVYKFYPKIDITLKPADIPNKFIEVLMMSNIYLKTLGADYDGDQISVRTVFSQEANLECERLMKAPTNFVSCSGTNVRTTSNEAIQTLYTLTK